MRNKKALLENKKAIPGNKKEILKNKRTIPINFGNKRAFLQSKRAR